jgi:hypothetical protein
VAQIEEKRNGCMILVWKAEHYKAIIGKRSM